jgi:hypothetical protein
MTASTKLEAVNIMLSTIGESPVNSLSSGLVDAELAETILNNTSRTVQAEGWHFNREYDLGLTPNLAGEIKLPNNVLRADASYEPYSKDLVQRGDRMYDKKEHTFKINDTVKLDIVVELEYEDLPEVAKRYISIKAARLFQARVLGSETLHGFTQEEETQAFYSLREFENDTEDFNVFDTYDVFRVIDRNRGAF